MRSDERLVLMPVLAPGNHRRPGDGACFTEVAAVLSTQGWGDHPGCTPPVLAQVARGVNDTISAAAPTQPAPLIPWAIGPPGPGIDLSSDTAVTAALMSLARSRPECDAALDPLLRRLERRPQPLHLLERVGWRHAARQLVRSQLRFLGASAEGEARPGRDRSRHPALGSRLRRRPHRPGRGPAAAPAPALHRRVGRRRDRGAAPLPRDRQRPAGRPGAAAGAQPAPRAVLVPPPARPARRAAHRPGRRSTDVAEPRAAPSAPVRGPVTALAVVALAPVAPGHRILAELDRALSAAVVVHRRRSWAAPTRRLSRLAAPPVVLGAVAGAASWAARRGVPPTTIARIIAPAAAGIGARRLLAETIDRPRPPAAWWWDEPTGPSYPSRHVVWAALGHGAAIDLLETAGGHLLGAAVRLGVTGTVAVSRVLLAVHWPSDVAAAVAFAGAWRQLTRPPLPEQRGARYPG